MIVFIGRRSQTSKQSKCQRSHSKRCLIIVSFSDIHKHFAISFRSPRYSDQNVSTAVPVNIQLRRPSDGQTSESLPFYYTPLVKSNRKSRSFPEPLVQEWPHFQNQEFIDFDQNFIQLEDFSLHNFGQSAESDHQLLDISHWSVKHAL